MPEQIHPKQIEHQRKQLAEKWRLACAFSAARDELDAATKHQREAIGRYNRAVSSAEQLGHKLADKLGASCCWLDGAPRVIDLNGGGMRECRLPDIAGLELQGGGGI